MPIVEKKHGLREISPPSFKRWEEEHQDEYASLEDAFSAWKSLITQNEELFKKHVYENDDLRELDLRQHRSRLFYLLAVGESVALSFLTLEDSTDRTEEVKNYVGLIDAKLAELRQTLQKWHGPLEHQEDLPKDFVEAVLEFKAGQVVDMETALNQPPQGV
jgi:hypothetical protein